MTTMLSALVPLRPLPVRVQRRRTKGWRMPPNTQAVDRSTAFGNFQGVYPYVTRTEAVRLSREWLMADTEEARNYRVWYRAELRGWNLACWCPLDQPCHGDVLLEIANT